MHNCDPATIAARAKEIADEVHAQIPSKFAAEVWKRTAVTAAEREDGSIVYIVSGAGQGLERAQKDCIDEIATLDAEGRPDIVAADDMAGAHAEPTGVRYAAANGLRPIQVV